MFKGTERIIFIDKRDFDGPLYRQIEEAYDFVLKHNSRIRSLNHILLHDTTQFVRVMQNKFLLEILMVRFTGR